jgi:hypothetical protein
MMMKSSCDPTARRVLLGENLMSDISSLRSFLKAHSLSTGDVEEDEEEISARWEYTVTPPTVEPTAMKFEYLSKLQQ